MSITIHKFIIQRKQMISVYISHLHYPLYVHCSKRIYDDMNEIYSSERLLSSNSLRGIITDIFDIGKKITE